MRLIELLDQDETDMNKQNNLDTATEITGITCDSRLVEPGFLFGALSGSKSHGNKFIDDAIARGASVILAENWQAQDLSVQYIENPNPRKQFSKMAARFSPGQPETVVGVTGTNGKTSVAYFLEQIWTILGINAASLGTLGLHSSNKKLSDLNANATHTTPDPVSLHNTLSNLAARGVSNLALEASSHGLAQYRLDGVKIKCAGFTNISRDHLDYHTDMKSYSDAKMRLFDELLGSDGVAVININRPEGLRVVDICKESGIKTITVGMNSGDISILKIDPNKNGQTLKIEIFGQGFEINLPLAGSFQAENAILALGLAIASEACGADGADCASTLENLKGVPGRMQSVGGNGQKIVFVDYAHTPDALETVLKNLRPHTDGKLLVVFGAGGDRDPGKREQMGSVAAKNADKIFVTDDNPRNEDPAQIRAAIMQGVPNAIEIPNRAHAISTAVDELQTGDVLLIAGKGHEQGQIIGDQTIPFDDVTWAEKAIAGAAK